MRNAAKYAKNKYTKVLFAFFESIGVKLFPEREQFETGRTKDRVVVGATRLWVGIRETVFIFFPSSQRQRNSTIEIIGCSKSKQ